MSERIVIATRESPLALWQAEHVKARLEAEHPDLDVRLLGMTSRGDQLLDKPLFKVGGKGLFVKELETALLDGRADIAVHSMKDVPMVMPDGLTLGVICEREDPRDALVGCDSFDQLAEGARLGTSSLRRSCQLGRHRPDLQIGFLRGNVNTRLAKLDSGEFDAIILACAGLIRLGFESRIGASIEPELSLPAAGQGAVGIEFREQDDRVRELLAPSIIRKLQPECWPNARWCVALTAVATCPSPLLQSGRAMAYGCVLGWVRQTAARCLWQKRGVVTPSSWAKAWPICCCRRELKSLSARLEDDHGCSDAHGGG